MRIINIIEVINGVPSINQSFGVYDEQLSEEIVKEAENLFIKLIKENSLDEDEEDIESAIEDGYWETEFQQYYSVHIIWSEIN